MKGKISADFLNKVKDAVNLVEIVGEHVVLRKSGANYSGLCPFHSERSPSFSVSEQKQLYHCYGCKKGGDLVSFVMEMNGISFAEAVEDLADRARIPLPKEWVYGDENADPETQKKRDEFRERLATAYRLNRFVSLFFFKQLEEKTPGAAKARKYLKGRGLQDEQLRSFYVGYAPDAWEALSSSLIQSKAPLALASELGLIRPSQKTGGQSANTTGYFDLFRDRVMFPIIDLRGRVAGFGGRSIPPEDAPPKYLNSSDSVTFQKSKLLYGLYQAQKHIREKNEVVLVEGYFDVIGLHAGGFENAVATCGTALTPDHLSQLQRLSDKIIVLFDSDAAGISATQRAMELGLERGLILYGAVLPPKIDPDEILFDPKTGERTRDGRERMREILAQARPLLDVRIETEMKEAMKGPESQTQAVRNIAGWLSRFKDPVGKEVRLKLLEEKWGMSPSLFQKAMGELAPRGAQVASPAPAQRPQWPKKPLPINIKKPQAGAQNKRAAQLSEAEKYVFQAIVQKNQSKHLNDALGKMTPGATLGDLFEYEPVKIWVEKFILNPDAEVVVSQDMDSNLRAALTEALVAKEKFGAETDHDRETNFHAALMRRVANYWARFSQQLKKAMTAAEASQDATLQANLMQEYLDVQRKMKEFIHFYDQSE